MSEDFYKILELSENASGDEIKKSYRRLSLLHHPDRNSNSTESVAKFQKISDAYETLGDVEKKHEYDMSRNNPFIKMMGQGPNMSHMHHMNQMNMNMGHMDDILAGLFGMNMGQGSPFGQFGTPQFGQGPPWQP